MQGKRPIHFKVVRMLFGFEEEKFFLKNVTMICRHFRIFSISIFYVWKVWLWNKARVEKFINYKRSISESSKAEQLITAIRQGSRLIYNKSKIFNSVKEFWFHFCLTNFSKKNTNNLVKSVSQRGLWTSIYIFLMIK